MNLIEIPLRDWKFYLHSTAAFEKAGNFNPDCRALASRRTNSVARM
ncbi:hypothetical protein [Methanosarcina sp. MSH10X1]|nr:hypothetical protein [Methanosarcina sp. MSH10X1]